MPPLHRDVITGINALLDNLSVVPESFFDIVSADPNRRVVFRSNGLAFRFSVFNWSVTAARPYIAYTLTFPLSAGGLGSGSLNFHLYNAHTRTVQDNRTTVEAGFTSYLDDDDDTQQAIHWG